jgi:hypothetical protein
MWKNQNHEVGSQRVAEALATYEEAVKEFSTNAAEFLEHVSLLVKARDAYQRALAVSTELRGILDKGDETLLNLMTRIQQSVDFQIASGAPDEKKREGLKVETIKTGGEKADAARA